MDKSIVMVCALCFFGISASCLAETPFHLPTDHECHSLPNAQKTDCLASVAKRLDDILLRYYEAGRSSIREFATQEEAGIANELEQAISSLEHAQSSWSAYRDAHCAMVANLFMNGSGKAAGEIECTIALTKGRIHELWQSAGFQPHSLPEPK